jgi:coproporphyrinogen III oxidase-like Fe-S oxidoreductase
MSNQEQNETPTLVTIQRIKDGSVNPKSLTKEMRQQCIEVLMAQGYTQAQMAQIMDCSDKTVQRDFNEIRKRNSLTPHPELAKEIVGEMLVKVRSYESNLNQLARSKDGTVSEKAQAQFLSWRMLKECIEKLQTLGYLPLKPQEVTGSIQHSFAEGEDKSFIEIQEIIRDIEMNLQNNSDPAMQEEVRKLKDKYERAKLASEAAGVLEKQKQLIQNQEAESNDESNQAGSN